MWICFIVSLLLQNQLELYYKVYLLGFIEVGEVFITYVEKGEELEIRSLARTTGLGKIIKKISNTGYAVIDKNTLIPKLFTYYQHEIGYIRFQEYKFQDDKVITKVLRYRDIKDKIGEEEEKEYGWAGEFEPYSASIAISKNSTKSGIVKIFYEGKTHYINYCFLRKEEIKIGIINSKANVVEIEVNVETRAPLKPYGKWHVWIDSKTYIPLQLKIGFTIGSVTVKIDKIKGDITLLTNAMSNAQ